MMTENRRVTSYEVREVAPGLWIWRVAHPEWRPELDWERFVTSTCQACYYDGNGLRHRPQVLVPPPGTWMYGVLQ